MADELIAEFACIEALFGTGIPHFKDSLSKTHGALAAMTLADGAFGDDEHADRVHRAYHDVLRTLRHGVEGCADAAERSAAHGRRAIASYDDAERRSTGDVTAVTAI